VGAIEEATPLPPIGIAEADAPFPARPDLELVTSCALVYQAASFRSVPSASSTVSMNISAQAFQL
jgi:hypothetical protein